MSDTAGKVTHTPGPWVVDGTNAFGVYGVWHHPEDGGGVHVCKVITGSFTLEDHTTRDERDANARLLAAAPELLAACEAAIAAGMMPDPGCVNRPEEIEATRVSLRMREAIAKARGEVPVPA